MTKNLETADTLAKMFLSVLVVVFYFSRVISGPLGKLLMILAVLVIAITIVKTFLFFVTRD